MNDKIPQASVFIIDASSFLYRAYYGIKPLHTSSGLAVQAVYGFCRMLKKLIDKYDVNHLVMVWDSKGKTHRHEVFPAYKATRQEPPSDIFEQKKIIQEIAHALGIVQLSQVGLEADDIMYSLIQKCHQQHFTAVIVSSDKDMRQVLTKDVLIYDPFFDVIMDEQSCQQRYGFEVEKLPFYFALLGDTSDNIPGVAGVGEKTALELVKQFKNLDDMYAHLDQVTKPRTQKLLQESKDNAYLSYNLFLLKQVDVALSIDQIKFNENNWANALPIFEKLEFKSFVKELKAKHPAVDATGQQALFAAQPEAGLHTKYDFVCVNQLQDLITLCSDLKKVSGFAIDTETDSLDPIQATLVGISIAYKKGQAFYIPIAHSAPQQLELDVILQYLNPILKDATIIKYMHNAKYDQLILMRAGFCVIGQIFDTLIAASLVTKEWEKNGLKDLSQNILHETMLSFKDVMQASNVKNFKDVSLELATQYAAADAHQTLQLVDIFKKEIETLNMSDLFYRIELPVNDVLVVMQQEGIFCDKEVLKKLSVQVDHDLSLIEASIHTLAGEQINLNSPKQIRKLLFETLQLPPQRKNTKSQEYSTDADVLQILAQEHKVAQMLLAYRELYKLKSTYIDALPEYINPSTGKIHTSWNQTGVATGRLSSSSPNLQNIPKNGLMYGKEYDVDIRAAFKPQQGWSFISADYSQIELRILAELSDDATLVQAFLSGKDIHVQTAAQIFKVPVDQVTGYQRGIGKTLNFSILYGLTAYGLSRDLMIPYNQAKEYIQLYFEQYPGVLKWMEGVIESVKRDGYTHTLYGRRRYLPGIYEKNKTLYDFARRIAINTPAQGTAAEITKLGMICFYQKIQEQGLQAKILLQIHDELLVMCPDEHIEQTQELLRQCLVGVVEFKIPLEVSIRAGKSWHDVTK